MTFTEELWQSIASINAAILRREAIDKMASRLHRTDLDVMRQHFLVASRYEWMFWEMGYRREAWPVSWPGGVFLAQSDRSKFKSLVLLGDEALEIRLAIRIFTTKAAVLEHDLTAIDVITESEATKGKTPLAFPERDSLQFLDVMGPAPVVRVDRQNLDGSLV